MFGGESGDEFAVQLPAAIEHREEGQELLDRQAAGDAEVAQLSIGAHGQRCRDHGHEQPVGGVEHVLRHAREMRRAVEEDEIVVVGERREQLLQPLRRLLQIVQREIEVTLSQIRRQQIEQRIVGAADRFAQILLALQQALEVVAGRALDAVVEARRALGIEIPQQRAMARAARAVGEVDRRGRLADAAFDVVSRNDEHAQIMAAR